MLFYIMGKGNMLKEYYDRIRIDIGIELKKIFIKYSSFRYIR